MKIILDIILLLIVAMCIWDGYKRGLIGGILGILAIIIALLGGNYLSSGWDTAPQTSTLRISCKVTVRCDTIML